MNCPSLGKKMHENIHEIVDFKKLKHTNNLCLKWLIRFNIPKKFLVKFVIDLMKNPNVYKQKLKVELRSQFTKDLKVMFYASEVENILCEQYSFMVLGLIKKFHINNPDDIEDYFSEGCMAVKYATWHYRNHKSKASFTTFVHRAIFMRIRNRKNKLNSKKIRRIKRGFIVTHESDCTIAFNSISKNCTIEPEFEFNIDDIIKQTKLDKREQFIINAYVNRKIDDLWYKEYRKKFPNVNQKKEYSRQSIYNQLLAVQIKIMNLMKSKNLIEPDFKIERKTRFDI